MDWFARLDIVLLRNFAIALYIGALVGVERERSHAGEPMAFGGIRTFTLVAMSAAVTAWFSSRTGSVTVLVAGFVGVAALTVAAFVAALGDGALRRRLAGVTLLVVGVAVGAVMVRLPWG